MTTMTIEAVAADRELLKLSAERDRLEARFAEVDQRRRLTAHEDDVQLDAKDFAENFPLAAAERKMLREREKKGRGVFSPTDMSPLDSPPMRAEALWRERELIRAHQGDVGRAIYQRQQTVRMDRLNDLQRTPAYRQQVLKVAIESATRNAAALDYLEATHEARQQGIGVAGVPGTAYRELDELARWLAAHCRGSVINRAHMEQAGLHPRLIAMVETAR